MTYRNFVTSDFDQPLDSTRYGQMDYILIKKHRKNIVKDCHATKNTTISSDHKMITAEFQVKLADKKLKDQQTTKLRFYKPTEEQCTAYND